MKLIVCLDADRGLLFNDRRQSQDQLQRQKVAKLLQGRPLYLNAYSYDLYQDIDNGHFCVSEDFLAQAGPDDYCLVENVSVAEYASRVKEVVIFWWQRHYPADVYFDLDVQVEPWRLATQEEFAGSSHEKILQETYVRVKI